ncbi:MAG: YfjI family protein [Planktomarina sp.]|nr:YfjI family protein [Planktomarina sp.]|tara:strand:- start:417 stop:1931 length:1515 start_codon:yes stop_codon:yes gene_type:complete
MNILPNGEAFKPEGPQPLLRDLPPSQPFPEEALGPLLLAVRAVQSSTQAPLAIPAASGLAMASLAVQGFADVETLGGRRPTSLYMLTIAKSGERKSSCDAPLIAGLRQHEKEQAKNREQALQSSKNARALWKAEHDRITANLKSRDSLKRTGAQADLEALAPEPDAPPSTDRVVTEPTYEGLTRLFCEGQPSLGIFSDEGGQFLGGHGMNSDNRQKTLAALNDLWGGNPIRRTRQGDGSFTLYDRRLAIHLMVQPTVAYEFMSDPLAADTGFLPRFLMCEPESTIGSRLYANTRHDGMAIMDFETRLRQILQTEMPMDEETRELNPRLLSLSDGARELLILFSDTIELEQAKGASLAQITGTASKSAEQAARIAGVLTLWRDLGATEINSDTMQNAIDLAQYYLHEALRLANASLISKQVQQAETLRKWLLDKWLPKHLSEPYVVPSDILQFGPNLLRERPKIKKAIAMLVEAGWLVEMPENTIVDGKPRKAAYQVIRASNDVV